MMDASANFSEEGLGWAVSALDVVGGVVSVCVSPSTNSSRFAGLVVDVSLARMESTLQGRVIFRFPGPVYVFILFQGFSVSVGCSHIIL